MSNNQRKFFKFNRKGFSLVELMIVVAIIGMLAAVGIPQYAKFQAKARQSEAKSNLSGLFNSMKSFQSEWNTYTNNLVNAGFGVEGKNLRYLTGFFSGVTCGLASTSGYQGPDEGTGAVTETWSDGTSNTAAATWHNLTVFSDHAATPGVGSSCGQLTFTGVSVGDPRNTPQAVDLNDTTVGDRWSIDNSKALSNIRTGIN